MHGGDIYRNNVKLDYSVNINPLGAPEAASGVMAMAMFDMDKYPDMECENLRIALEGELSVPRERIVCGNGASDLIMAICHARRPKTAILVAPGFEGYEVALNAVDTRISYHFLDEKKKFLLDDSIVEKIRQEKPEIVFICNPNNPTGLLVEKPQMFEIANVCQEVGALLVIDECFIELVKKMGEYTMVRLETLYQNMIILRAFTKTYGIPGLRLGYAVCSTVELAESIRRHQSEWCVSQVAQDTGVVALRDKKYLEQAVKLIDDERHYLSNKIAEFGITVFPSYANFILIKDAHTDLYAKLLEKDILIRECKDMMGLEKGFFRIAVKKHPENCIFLQKLEEVKRRE